MYHMQCLYRCMLALGPIFRGAYTHPEVAVVGPEPVTLSCFSLPCDLCYTLTDGLPMHSGAVWQRGSPRGEQQYSTFSPETLRPGQWAVSFLRAHAVVSCVGLVAWLGAGGSVV